MANAPEDLFLTITEVDTTHPHGVSLHIARRFIKPDAHYLSHGRPLPLWRQSTIAEYAEKRDAIAAATAALNVVQV
jgi:hypothetical protein